MNSNKIAEYQKRLNKLKAESSKFWKPSEGVNLLRILPPIKPEDDFYHETRIHFVRGAGDKGQNTAAVCLGTKCPICKALRAIEQNPELDVMGIANDCKGVACYYMNVLDMKNTEAGVQIYRLTAKSIIESLLEHLVDPEWGEFFSLKAGNTVKIVMEKKGARTTYSTSLKPKKTSLPSSYLEQRKDLSHAGLSVDLKEAKRLAEFICGESNFAKEEDEDDFEQVKRKAHKIKKKRGKTSQIKLGF